MAKAFFVLKNAQREFTGKMGAPDILQVDTIQSCNANCVYCNPQHCFGLSGGKMSIKTVETILQRIVDAGWKYHITQWRPYMNGEPTLHPNLKEICYLGESFFPFARTIVLTNGITVKELPLDIGEISFTISAATPETYVRVHGVDAFRHVISNLRYVYNNKSPDTSLHVSFVANRYNLHELNYWRAMIGEIGEDIVQDISPIHSTVSQQASHDTIALNNDEIIQIATLCTPTKLRCWRACNCYNNLSVGLNGEFLTCCDLDYSHALGNILTDDPQKLWMQRCKAVFTDPDCLSCNLRNPSCTVFK